MANSTIPEFQQVPNVKKWNITIASVVALLVIGVWGFMTLYISAKLLGILKSQQGIDFSGVLGIYSGVTSVASIIISYYFGSSKGSEDKSKQIDTLMNNKSSNAGNAEKTDT